MLSATVNNLYLELQTYFDGECCVTIYNLPEYININLFYFETKTHLVLNLQGIMCINGYLIKDYPFSLLDKIKEIRKEMNLLNSAYVLFTVGDS